MPSAAQLQNYLFLPLANPYTDYRIKRLGSGFSVSNTETGRTISWKETGRPIEYPTRERAEMVIRTQCNPTRH